MLYVNTDHVKMVSKQAAALLTEGKKPTIKDPYLTFLEYFYDNSIMVKTLRDERSNYVATTGEIVKD